MKVHALLGDRVGADIAMISISIDPEFDTPDRLLEYWKSYGSNPGWTYLTGNYDEIDRLRHAMGVYDLDPVVDADVTQHAGLLTIGNDRIDRWTALPALMDVEGMVETIGRVTREGRGRGRSSVAPSVADTN